MNTMTSTEKAPSPIRSHTDMKIEIQAGDLSNDKNKNNTAADGKRKRVGDGDAEDLGGMRRARKRSDDADETSSGEALAALGKHLRKMSGKDDDTSWIERFVETDAAFAFNDLAMHACDESGSEFGGREFH